MLYSTAIFSDATEIKKDERKNYRNQGTKEEKEEAKEETNGARGLVRYVEPINTAPGEGRCATLNILGLFGVLGLPRADVDLGDGLLRNGPVAMECNAAN